MKSIKYWWTIYISMAVVALLLSLLVLPIGDDWMFLNYFDNAENWGVHKTSWLYDCIFLPRGMWRVWEDILWKAETHLPWIYPYPHHILTVLLFFGAGYVIIKITQKLGFNDVRSIAVITIGMIMTNNMGSLFSVDSFAHVMGIFFGLLSAYCYISGTKYKYLLWLFFGIIGAFSKETGFVFFLCGPLLSLVKLYGEGYNDNWLSKHNIKPLLIGCLPIITYLIVYYTFTSIKASQHIAVVTHQVINDESAKSVGDLLTSSQQSYSLTPVTLVKNIFILYVAGIFPVDTSAIYYSQWILLGISALLSLSGIFLFANIVKCQDFKDKRLWILAMLVFVISSPSLITRAGEISPFASNTMLILLFAYMVNNIKWTNVNRSLLAIYIIMALATDMHKYILAYKGGHIGQSMAKEIVAKTKANPQKVLWIGPDETSLKKAGVAFNDDPYCAFSNGKAAIAEYGYVKPEKLDNIVVPLKEWNEQIKDSIIQENKDKYNCIWITERDKVEVINLK